MKELALSCAFGLMFVGDAALADEPNATFADEPPSELVELVQRRDLPRWQLYRRGECTADDVTPREVDEHCGLIAFRDGDEHWPDRWVFLSLTKAWLEGTREYFHDLLLDRAFDVADLVVIAAELDAHAELPVLPEALSLDTFKDGPDLGWNPYPDGLPIWSPAPEGVPAWPRTGAGTPAMPRPAPPSSSRWDRPATHGVYTPSPAERLHRFGVSEEEARFARWLPTYPGTDFWKHGGAQPEPFRCDGVAYVGYYQDCPDYCTGGKRVEKQWKDKTSEALHGYLKREWFKMRMPRHRHQHE